MFRPAKTAKAAIHIGLFLLVLLALYLLNNDKSQFNPELRESVLSDYDYYMDEYKDAGDSNYADMESLFVADVGRPIEELSEKSLLPEKDKESKKAIDELVIVVVETSNEENMDSSNEEGSRKSKPLESPSEVPEANEDDVLRENDILVDGIVIDRSEDLYEVSEYRVKRIQELLFKRLITG